MYIHFNANPVAQRGEDCTVRAIAKVTDKTWVESFLNICLYALVSFDMPSANHVWGSYLYDMGYRRHMVNEMNSTVKDFARTHPQGRYILALRGHIVAVIDGDYYDTWDSGDEIPVYYWERSE